MMQPEPVSIIGINIDSPEMVSSEIRSIINQATELWGGERLLRNWTEDSFRKVLLDKNLPETLQRLKTRDKNARIVILASGDPGFYGIAASVLKILPLEEVRIFPAVSSLQTAFARIGTPWQNAGLISAHSRPIWEVVGLARRHAKLGILTDPVQTPAWIAKHLLNAGIPDCRAVVCENLGEKHEKIIDSRLSKIANQIFSPLNVLLLIQDDGWKPLPTPNIRADSDYCHKNGLITKRDIRIISLERLRLQEADVVWDIGAGSGAMSVEIAETVWRGKVFAVEKDEDCLACIRENSTRYGAMNLQILAGQAPEILMGLPAPSAVFIGGSGGNLLDILNHVKSAADLGCRIVANFTVMENLMSAHQWMKKNEYDPTITEALFSYSVPIGNGTRFTPSNPIFILSGKIKKEAKP